MASKRRKAAAKKTGVGAFCLKSPARSSSSSRRKAAAEDAQDGESPCSKAEETSSYKTPKRRLASRSRLPTFSSPVNETDIQQEIFWDPHSPIAPKLGNEQKKQAVSGRTVDISEIVNRIAPQDERPACNEGSLLGLWIGDDAIPCTPGLTKVRSRVKVNGARGLRLKNREEELMKLAKQFDKNLTDAIQDQDAPCHNVAHISSEGKTSIEPQDGVAKEDAGSVEHCENGSQKSIDFEAEVALNDLFDCSTQKCSGQLSQSLSDCSSNSSFHGNRNTLLKDKHTSDNATAASECVVRDGPQRQVSSLAVECMAAIPPEKAEMTSEQTVPITSSSKVDLVVSNKLDRIVGDDFEDWGADLLPDDSFVMQITQDPELINIPANALCHTSNKSSEAKKSTAGSEKPYTFDSSNKVPASCALQKTSVQIETPKAILLHKDFSLKTDKMESISESCPNKTSGCNSVSVKSGNKSVQGGFTQLKCVRNDNFSEKRAALISVPCLPKPQTGKYRSNMHSVNYQLSTVSATTKALDRKKATSQRSTGHLKQTDVPKKNVLLFDDWNEPRFSDDVLDLFCESNSLWGANCDDDDLLYQVCDDVEKSSLSQEVANENEKAKSVVASASKLKVGSCLAVPIQGLSHCLQAHVGRKTFSLDPPVTITKPLKNENSANSPVQHTCAPFKSESVNGVPGKWRRSLSVPEGGFASGSSSATLSTTCLNVNNMQWQNGLYNVAKVQNSSKINQVSAEKVKYVFRKTNSSQALVLDHKNVNIGDLSRTKLGLWESKNAPNIPFQATLQMNQKPAFKRHLSDGFAQSGTDQRSRKCSQEEIARKKQEALERRKCKMQASLKNTAPT
ncbi:ewing's tumor-associated antigen 1 [Elgaria multicarinata webbii]|uniref:ewing's tumor-associated antigen 1 n=1 Tax=Elgaria multicarinata webbii TaxID=159646 RepID=UPI002FCD51D2